MKIVQQQILYPNKNIHEVMEIKNMTYLKKAVFILCITYIATISQTIWAMWEYRHPFSTSLFRFSFVQEIIIFWGFLPIIPFALVLFISYKFRIRKLITIILLECIQIYLWFQCINKTIFDERHASWSTYSSQEINYYVFQKSIVPMSVCCVLTFAFIFMILKKSKQFE
jgi:hypothetical protein